MESIEIELIAQDHRSLRVWRNFFRYIFCSGEPRRRASVEAVVRWCFLGSNKLVILGGIFAAAIAFQANNLLDDQNLKLDLQNRLLILQTHQEEAQRSIEAGRQLHQLMRKVGRGRFDCDGFTPDPYLDTDLCPNSGSTESKNAYCIGENLIQELSAFSSTVQPYRIVSGDLTIRTLYTGSDDIAAEARGIQYWLGLSRSINDDLELLPVPQLSSSRRSPERGELIRRLLVEQRIRGAFGAKRKGMILESAHLPPGTSLDGADLTNVKLRNADFTAITLNNAVAVDGDFRGSSLRFSKLKCSTFSNALFQDVDLYNADLSGSNLIAARGRSPFLQNVA